MSWATYTRSTWLSREFGPGDLQGFPSVSNVMRFSPGFFKETVISVNFYLSLFSVRETALSLGFLRQWKDFDSDGNRNQDNSMVT